MSKRAILIAGIGNIFLGDDAFGVEVVRLLQGRALGDTVRVVDIGIRAFDLMLALEQCDVAILIDAVRHSGSPGTLLLLDVGERAEDATPLPVEPHALDVTALVRGMDLVNGRCKRVLMVACDCGPEPCGDPMQMSGAVRAALEPAAEMVERTLARIRAGAVPAHSPVGAAHSL